MGAENKGGEKCGEKIKISLCPLDEYSFAYDVRVLAADLTVGEYMDALDDFQARTLADCYGCDGCCHERVPLSWPDYFLSGRSETESLGEWLLRVGELSFWGEAVDLTLKRTEDGSCHLLDVEAKCCTDHLGRTFTCRTHCCLPKTERAEALRAAVINAGEDELVRRMLALGDRPWAAELAAKGVDAADYAANGFSDISDGSDIKENNIGENNIKENWRAAKIIDLVEPELWQKLLVE